MWSTWQNGKVCGQQGKIASSLPNMSKGCFFCFILFRKRVCMLLTMFMKESRIPGFVATLRDTGVNLRIWRNWVISFLHMWARHSSNLVAVFHNTTCQALVLHFSWLQYNWSRPETCTFTWEPCLLLILLLSCSVLVTVMVLKFNDCLQSGSVHSVALVSCTFHAYTLDTMTLNVIHLCLFLWGFCEHVHV